MSIPLRPRRNARPSLSLLGEYGDPIEQLILRDGCDLSDIMTPYADIWAEHVYPRRHKRKLWKIDDDWMPFAGSHYTALIRTFQAGNKLNQIVEIAEAFENDHYDADHVLLLQDSTAAFWQHIDQAIEHLSYAYQDAPLPLRLAKVARIREKWSVTGVARRDDLLTFYSRIPSMVSEKLYRSVYPRRWTAFRRDIASVWWDLSEKLNRQDHP